MSRHAIGLSDLGAWRLEPRLQVVEHLTAHGLFVYLRTGFWTGKIVICGLVERRYTRGTLPTCDSGRGILHDKLRGLIAGACKVRLGLCPELDARRFDVHVFLAMKGLLRLAREQAKTIDLGVLKFGVRTGVLAGRSRSASSVQLASSLSHSVVIL